MVMDAYNLLVKYGGNLNNARPDELVKVLMHHSPEPEKEINHAIQMFKEHHGGNVCIYPKVK